MNAARTRPGARPRTGGGSPRRGSVPSAIRASDGRPRTVSSASQPATTGTGAPGQSSIASSPISVAGVTNPQPASDAAYTTAPAPAASTGISPATTAAVSAPASTPLPRPRGARASLGHGSGSTWPASTPTAAAPADGAIATATAPLSTSSTKPTAAPGGPSSRNTFSTPSRYGFRSRGSRPAARRIHHAPSGSEPIAQPAISDSSTVQNGVIVGILPAGPRRSDARVR